jgi:predicted PurR-regulated permease PerM
VARGVILLAIGALLIGLVDNVLRPILVGRDTQIPDFLILIATLGGLTVFGLSGFVIGPIIAAFFLVVWDMFAEEFGDAEDALEAATDEITPAPAEAPPNDAA